MINASICPSCNDLANFSKKRSQYYCAECDLGFEAEKSPIQSQDIFLSYAHKSEREEDFDISEDLVWLIKEELERDGHKVWIDHEGIRGGTHWRERITDAITSHRHFLAFLSKRSVRQDPNVCLNEVAIAIKHNRIIQTILTESENRISAPLTLSSIQWHKFQDWKEIKEGKKTGPKGEDWEAWFGGLMGEIRQNLVDITHQQKVGELGELFQILSPSSFTADIIQSVEGFYGRRWLFEAYREWLPTDRRLFWLKGSPGIGKSSFAAKLVHDGNSEVVGFFKCSFQNLKSAEDSASECIRTLAYQLASRLPDYRIKLLRGQMLDRETVQKKTADDLFTYLITEPLNRAEKIAESQRLVLVIDALDEAGRRVGGVDVNPLADLIYKHAQKLPAWLGIVVTSRAEAYLQQQLGPKFAPMVIEGGSEQNTQDIKDYLNTKLDEQIKGQERARIIDAVIEKSGGTFLYLKRVELSYDLSKPETLPIGIDDVFLKDFQRYFPDPNQYAEKTEKFLRLMVAAPGPLPKELGQEVLKCEARDITVNVTQPMASMLIQNSEGLQLYHKSLKEWLVEGSKSGLYQVNSSGGRELGECLWSEFELVNSKANKDQMVQNPKNLNSNNAVKKWEDKLLSWLPELLIETSIWNNYKLLDRFAKFLGENLIYTKELKIRKQALILLENELGLEHEKVASAMTHVARVVRYLGFYTEAEALYRKSLFIREKTLGQINEKTSDSMGNLGLILKTIGKYEEAEYYYKKDLEITEAIKGKDSIETGTPLNNLGALFRAQGKFTDAESYYQRALDIRVKILGYEDLKTANSLNSMGLLLNNLKRYEEASNLLKKACEIREKLLGIKHPSTARTVNNLALVLFNLGSFEEAEKLYKQSLEVKEKVFGAQHPEVATTLRNLVNLYKANGRFDEAEQLALRDLEINKIFFGQDGDKTVKSREKLIDLYEKWGKTEAAEKIKRDQPSF